MKFLTKYKLKKAFKEIEPQQDKKADINNIKKVYRIMKWGFFSPIWYLLKKTGNWINKQHFGLLFIITLFGVIFAILVANTLRYGYWLKIMQTNYPNEVLVALDKVLIEWNARMNAFFFIMFHIIIGIFIATVNNIYGSDEPQVTPGTKRLSK